MMEWFNSLEPALKIYWGIALIASLFFVIQTIVSFVSGHAFDGNVDTDVDTDTHSHGGVSQFFSVRNLVSFLLGAGWGGVCFYSTISSKTLLMIVALCCGIAFVLIFFFLVKILLKLGKDNTFRLSETLGKTADVYLFIPEKKSSAGKIQISVNGSVHELDALTNGEKINTGAKVRVVEIIDNRMVLVEKI
jgi:membrane protein implicated in regulation of membrane protease activity